VAVDSKGNAVVAFQHAGQLWANYYTVATNSWGTTPVAIDPRTTTSYRPLVAVDKNGNYLVVWQQDPNDTNKGIWWSSSTNGKTWTTPAVIGSKTLAGMPQLSMNADGAAVVAWPDTDTTMNYNYRIMASVRPTATGAWTTPKILRDASDGGGDDPTVAMSGQGEAFVLWVQSDGPVIDKYSIWMSQYKGSWSTAALFESYNDSHAFGPAIAANAAGDAIGVYSLVDASGLTESMWARRYTMAGGFEATPVNVTQGKAIDSYQAPAVVLDESRVATVAWPFQIQNKFQVFASRAGATSAWPTATQLETDDEAAKDPNDFSAQATTPTLGIAPTGNVTLLWRKRIGTRFDLWTAGFPKSGTAWGAPKKLETTDTDSVDWLSLGVGTDGTAIAVWNYAAEQHIWSAIFR
jgi:hypothetical protein